MAHLRYLRFAKFRARILLPFLLALLDLSQGGDRGGGEDPSGGIGRDPLGGPGSSTPSLFKIYLIILIILQVWQAWQEIM